MKKGRVINQPIASVISGLGHGDTITIADAGLPIPNGTTRIDLALTTGVPSFLQTLQVVLEELFVERAIIAAEMRSISPQVFDALSEILGDVPVETTPHDSFKEQSAESKAIIRTGEFTPYANVILIAGAWGFDLD